MLDETEYKSKLNLVFALIFKTEIDIIFNKAYVNKIADLFPLTTEMDKLCYYLRRGCSGVSRGETYSIHLTQCSIIHEETLTLHSSILKYQKQRAFHEICLVIFDPLNHFNLDFPPK